jgi:hypothetical protein
LQLLFAVAVTHHSPHEYGGVGQQANVAGTVAHGHLRGLAVVSNAAKLDGGGGNQKAAAVNLPSVLLSVGRGVRSRDGFENANLDLIDD